MSKNFYLHLEKIIMSVINVEIDVSKFKKKFTLVIVLMGAGVLHNFMTKIIKMVKILFL